MEVFPEKEDVEDLIEYAVIVAVRRLGSGKTWREWGVKRRDAYEYAIEVLREAIRKLERRQRYTRP
ncbi:MAG: hypothetical protein NDF52_05305 [archaeon YNP-WB-062]|jgi:hypothetical protein|nr:hypothetical protein [Candidatus Culexarchaeum yellowstonense]